MNILKRILSGARYARLLSILIRDSIGIFKLQTLLIFVFGIIGTVSQVGAVAMVVTYIRIIEGQSSYVFNGVEYSAQSVQVLFQFSVLLFVLLVTASILIYISNSQIIKLRISYEIFCSKRIFEIVLNNSKSINRSNTKELLMLINRDSNYCGRVLAMVLRMFRPVVVAVISFVAMIYVNTVLSIILFLLVGVSVLFQYRASRSAAKNSLLMENLTRSYMTEKKNLLEDAISRGSDLSKEKIDQYYSSKFSNYYSSYWGKLVSIERSGLIGNFLFSVVIALVLLILVPETISSNKSWSEVLVYFLALRLGFTNLNSINKQVTNISRFYPQVNRYFRFANQKELIQKEIDPILASSLIEDNYDEVE